MNKVFLFGNVGKDPEVKTLESGKKIAKFSLATSSFSKDKDGNKVTQTEWHNIILWEKLAELAGSYVKKGSSVIIEGEIRYRQYTDKDNNTKYFTEILGNAMHFTGKKEEEKTKETKSVTKEDILQAEDDPSYSPF
jgi:single-strand DNA-binding protein